MEFKGADWPYLNLRAPKDSEWHRQGSREKTGGEGQHPGEQGELPAMVRGLSPTYTTHLLLICVLYAGFETAFPS